MIIRETNAALRRNEAQWVTEIGLERHAGAFLGGVAQAVLDARVATARSLGGMYAPHTIESVRANTDLRLVFASELHVLSQFEDGQPLLDESAHHPYAVTMTTPEQQALLRFAITQQHEAQTIERSILPELPQPPEDPDAALQETLHEALGTIRLTQGVITAIQQNRR